MSVGGRDVQPCRRTVQYAPRLLLQATVFYTFLHMPNSTFLGSITLDVSNNNRIIPILFANIFGADVLRHYLSFLAGKRWPRRRWFYCHKLILLILGALLSLCKTFGRQSLPCLEIETEEYLQNPIKPDWVTIFVIYESSSELLQPQGRLNKKTEAKH
jgi:hypothetical protein